MVNVAPAQMAADAYGVCLRHYKAFLHLGLGWGVLLIGLVVAGMLPWPDMIGWPLTLASLAAVPIAGAGFFVSCCRVILLDEETPAAITLGFGARERRCAAHLLGILALPAVPWLLFLMIARADSWWAPLATAIAGGPVDLAGCLKLLSTLALMLMLSVIAAAASARLAIALPAIALDEPGKLFLSVWQHSRGLGRPLFYAALLCALPVLLAPTIFFCLDRGVTAEIAGSVAEVLACPLGLFAVAVAAAFYSYVFALLAEAPAEDEAASRALVAD